MSTFRHKPTGKKFFFAHIPRTAGRFIETNLMVNNEFEWCDDWNKFGITLMYESYEGIEFGHFHREYYEKYLDLEGIPQISVIRNPLKRFISASIYINRVYAREHDGTYTEEGLAECQKLMEDENYFYSMMQNFPMMMPESANWYRPQVDFISDKTHIWKFENGFKEEFATWLGNIVGVDFKFDEDLDYIRRPDEGIKLKPTPKLLDNVRTLYKEEIEKFYPDI